MRYAITRACLAATVLAASVLAGCTASHPPDDGGTDPEVRCELAGDYVVPSSMLGFDGHFQFRGDGTWVSTLLREELDAAEPWGTWDRDGATLFLTGGPCDFDRRDEVGEYEVSFDATCDAMTLTVVEDPCARELDGLTFTRLAR